MGAKHFHKINIQMKGGIPTKRRFIAGLFVALFVALFVIANASIEASAATMNFTGTTTIIKVYHPEIDPPGE